MRRWSGNVGRLVLTTHTSLFTGAGANGQHCPTAPSTGAAPITTSNGTAPINTSTGAPVTTSNGAAAANGSSVYSRLTTEPAIMVLAELRAHRDLVANRIWLERLARQIQPRLMSMDLGAFVRGNNPAVAPLQPRQQQQQRAPPSSDEDEA